MSREYLDIEQKDVLMKLLCLCEEHLVEAAKICGNNKFLQTAEHAYEARIQLRRQLFKNNKIH